MASLQCNMRPATTILTRRPAQVARKSIGVARSQTVRVTASGMAPDLKKSIDELIASNKVVVSFDAPGKALPPKELCR